MAMKNGHLWREAKRGAYLCALVGSCMFLPCLCMGGKGPLVGLLSGAIGLVVGSLLGGIVGFIGAGRRTDDTTPQDAK